MKKYSKFLSLVLRHKPEVAGLTLDQNGWAETSKVVQALRSRFGEFSHAMLNEIVETNDKQRFIIEGTKIRANQGHSLDIDLQLEPAIPPATLYHGTLVANLDSIMEKGLVKGKRQHVHLSVDTNTASRVAGRRQGNSMIFVLDTSAMSELVFFKSENGVWLTDWVAPHFLDPRTAIYL